MNKHELLAPAGNINSAYAAINAGADAIYLGAEKFSARAFADNLTDEQIIHVIKLAHLRNISVYLTLNTLINDDEYSEIPKLLTPLYEAGLDGIIVQDLGVAGLIRDRFPNLLLHASTQMSIMSSFGAQMLKENGYVRVVPSRELTLPEIIKIKQDTGMELECFIHGAMCYSYSGLCLMSSLIGGRSGNRGKCAGTCRLPFRFISKDYSVSNEEYPLSMKDMCTASILPKLMDAGIDSFKIEGRMKSPEYVAGVTSIYRKIIDNYLSDKNKNVVSCEDMEVLSNLYIRTEISQGFYEGKKGRELITLNNPGYNGGSEEYIDAINKKYVHEPDALPVSIYVYAHCGMPLGITISYLNSFAYAEGPVCEKASDKPLSQKRLSEQVGKLGGTGFAAENIDIDTSGDVFLPMSAINECRRAAVKKLYDEIDIFYGRKN